MPKNIFKIPTSTLIFALTLFFSGCASLDTPQPKIDVAKELKWWEKFNDNNLNYFEEKALQNNSSLLAKLYNYEKAKLNVDLSTNSMLPNFSASLNGNASRAIDKSDTTTKSFSSNLNVTYEADLFGKLRSAKNIKELEATASMQDYLSARLVLASKVAKHYFQIAYINESIKLTRQNIAYQTNIVDLAKVKFKAGAISKLDLLSSEQSLLTLNATIDNLELEKKTAISSLALLLDIEPQSVLANLPNSLQKVNIPQIGQIPASALSHRPDMIANELRLKEAFVGIDAAKLSFYPTLNLTNSIGTSSNEMLNILRNPVGSIGLNILLPFINYNANAINYKISKVEFEKAKADFRTSLFTAMKEINDAINANEIYALKNKKLEQNLMHSKEMKKLSFIRYKAGAISMSDFMQISQTAINSEQSFLDNKYKMLTARIDLFETTGGK